MSTPGSELGNQPEIQRHVHGVAIAAARVGVNGKDAVVDVVPQLLAKPRIRSQPLHVRQEWLVVLRSDCVVDEGPRVESARAFPNHGQVDHRLLSTSADIENCRKIEQFTVERFSGGLGNSFLARPVQRVPQS